MNNQFFPAPWALTGSAYIVFLQMPKNLREQFKKYRSPISMLMLVQYNNSPVGSYNEIAFIPGQLLYKKKWYWSVSHMLVSSEASTINGQKNWGFPKQTAHINWNKMQNEDHIFISQENKTVGEFNLKSSGSSLALNTRFFPQFLFRIMQPYQDKIFCVTPNLKAKLKLAKIGSLKIEGDFFPDLGLMRNCFALHLPNFILNFPSSDISLS